MQYKVFIVYNEFDEATRQREYDPSRSVRLHWVRYHLKERKNDSMNEYYLLTAYYMEGKEKARNKMAKKWKRRIKEDL